MLFSNLLITGMLPGYALRFRNLGLTQIGLAPYLTFFNETPRRKQRGILLDYNFFFVASDGEFNP
jgi:hypothetical protein